MHCIEIALRKDNGDPERPDSGGTDVGTGLRIREGEASLPLGCKPLLRGKANCLDIGQVPFDAEYFGKLLPRLQEFYFSRCAGLHTLLPQSGTPFVRFFVLSTFILRTSGSARHAHPKTVFWSPTY